MMQPANWRWYGTWVVDWLTCGRDDDFASGGWLAFDIWAKAYRKANSDLEEVSDFELIDCYREAMEPIFNSWIFFIWRFLQWPMNRIHELVWRIKLRFFFREL